MQDYAFKIRGMDCAEEVAILKRELGPGFGEENLRFDVMNGKLIVASEDGGTTRDKVVELVRNTGMEAIPWDKHVSQAKNGDSFWARRGRAILTVLSGVCIFLGFVWHSTQHGIFDALTGGEAERHQFPLSVIILYLVGIVSGGWFIFPKAWYAARRLRPDMNLLMTVAVVGAALISEWFEAATVTLLFAVALLLESWSVARARRAISGLLDLSPETARYYEKQSGDVVEAPIADVPLGATVLVRPGERIPLDGDVTKGRTKVNQAPITGESKPVTKEPGDPVYAGTINDEGAFEFEATKEASDTTLARIIRMVEDAQSRRAESEQWVEKFARYYTPVMMLLAVGIAILPPLLLGGSWYTWFYEALVILVIACPCALVISTPVSIVAGLSAAARAGVLVKGGVYLEMPARVRAIAMDKTGTLTLGQPEVQRVEGLNGTSEEELLRLAAALESSSEHPLARAILRRVEQDGVTVQPAENFQAIKGKGATGTIDGGQYWIGSHRLVHEMEAEGPGMHERAEQLEDAGHTVVALGKDNLLMGLISVGDGVRPEAMDCVEELRDEGIEIIVMLTGDNEGTAKAVSEATGVAEYRAELLPEDKVETVRELVDRWEHVAMVGDGVNDAPAMAEASFGIAMGAMGTDVAIETADIALMTDDLRRLPWLVRHSKRTLRVIRQNIFFALGVKAVFIVLAFAGLATLWMAIAADTGASLLVIFNGLRLLRMDE
ncbi:MAG: heavy metal translocating P-type ATPase [Candidatus Hydrogenedentes bacterium]|nr:heavy metal translocating P-type ATPase [Candidatus Hydrogenedentota bacterium]